MDNIPETEQGLKDFIRAGEAELKRQDKKLPELKMMIQACRDKLNVIQYK